MRQRHLSSIPSRCFRLTPDAAPRACSDRDIRAEPLRATHNGAAAHSCASVRVGRACRSQRQNLGGDRGRRRRAAAILAAINLFHCCAIPILRSPRSPPDRLDLQRKTNQALEERLTRPSRPRRMSASPQCSGPAQTAPAGAGKANVPAPPRRGQSQPGSTAIANLIDKATVLT